MSGSFRIVWTTAGYDAQALAQLEQLGAFFERPAFEGDGPGDVIVEVSGLSELERAYLLGALQAEPERVRAGREPVVERRPEPVPSFAPRPLAAGGDEPLSSGGFDAVSLSPAALRQPARRWLDELSAMLSAVAGQGMLPPDLSARWASAISSLKSVEEAEALAFECAKAVYNACAGGYDGLAILLRLQLAEVSSIERALTAAAEQGSGAEPTVEA